MTTHYTLSTHPFLTVPTRPTHLTVSARAHSLSSTRPPLHDTRFSMPFKGEILSFLGIAQMVATVGMLGHWIGCVQSTHLFARNHSSST